MNEILDLLPIPEARDFPAGQFEARRAALVAAIRVDAANEPLASRVTRLAGKAWLTLLGILALGIAPLVLGSAQQRSVPRDAVAVLAAAGTAQIMVAVMPRVGRAGSFSVSAGQRFHPFSLSQVSEGALVSGAVR
jgi:hypothetical protein